MRMLTVLRLVSFIGAAFCLSNIAVFNYPFWILVVSYTLYLFLSKSIKNGISTPGLIAIHLTMFGRYFLLPIAFYATGEIPSCAKGLGYLNEALYLMFFEQLCVFIALEATANHFNKTGGKRKNFGVNIVRNDNFLIYLLFTLFLILTVLFKDLGFGLRVLLSGNLYEFSNMADELPKQNGFQIIVGIIWQVLSIWLYVHLMLLEKQRYDKDQKAYHVNKALIYSFLLILVSFIDQTGLSRWYTVVNAGIAIACLTKFFPEHKKRTFLAIGMPGLVLIVFASLIKSAGYIVGQSSVSNSWVGLFQSELLDSYFAGPVNVNNVFYIDKLNKTGLTTILNDVFNNMPIMNHFFNNTESSSYYHNDLAGRIIADSRGDQIIPLVGQSYLYFGTLFSPILSIIGIILVRLFDSKYKQENSYLTFVYAFCAIWIGVQPMALNLSICLSWFYVRIVPDYIALRLLYKVFKAN